LSLSIEEVDRKLRFGNPSSRLPAYFVWLLTLIYWGTGTYWIIRNLIEASPLVVSFVTLLSKELMPLITKNISLIVTYLTIIVSIVFIASFILLILVRKVARVILMIMLILSLVFDSIVGIASLFFGSLEFGVISLVIAFILGFIMFRY